MTPERKKQLRAMEQAASEGPYVAEVDAFGETEWEAAISDAGTSFLFTASTDVLRHLGQVEWTAEDSRLRDECYAKAKASQAMRNAVLMAESRTAVPELLDEVERLQRQVVEADSWMDDAKNADRQTIGSLRAALAAMTAARDEACDIAERRGAAIDYLCWKIDGYDTTKEVADEIEHGTVDLDGRAQIKGAERLPEGDTRIAELREVGAK